MIEPANDNKTIVKKFFLIPVFSIHFPHFFLIFRNISKDILTNRLPIVNHDYILILIILFI